MMTTGDSRDTTVYIFLTRTASTLLYTCVYVRGTREKLVFFTDPTVTRQFLAVSFKEHKCNAASKREQSNLFELPSESSIAISNRKDTTFLGEIQIFSWFFAVFSLLMRIFAAILI